MTKAVQQNPDQVGTRVKSTTQRRFGRAAAGARGAAGRAGTGFPLAGPVVRTVLPGPAPVRLRRPHAPHPRRVRATPGPSRREPGSRQVFPEVPGARVEAARPPGARILIAPGAASEIERADGGLLRAA